jgi:hypothetical protein
MCFHIPDGRTDGRTDKDRGGFPHFVPPGLFHIPPHVQITFYLPPPPPDHCLCTSPTYRVALEQFHQKKDVTGRIYASITPHL